MRILRASDLPASFFLPPADGGAEAVRRIVAGVRRGGDRALRRYTLRFDGVRLREIRVPASALAEALRASHPSLRRALRCAARRIGAFAARQRRQLRDFEFQTAPGVFCGQRAVALERAGVYVPGGRFPLLSSLLMAAVPAQVAGVAGIAVCSPPAANGLPHPSVLAAAALLGLDEVYAVGGAQAVAGLAFGTETIRAVDKIVGPGNRFVTLAKQEVSGRVGIDLLAGPSEIFIVAGRSADPELAAADLLAQAEHDPDARAVLLTDSPSLAAAVCSALRRQLRRLPTRRTAAASLRANGLVVLVSGIEEAARICNRCGPEHLELLLSRPRRAARRFRHFGSLFLGRWAAEALGDYSSGLNHTLPTGGRARFASGLSVRDFIKLSTTLRVERHGLAGIAPAARTLAEAEGLSGHGRSLEIRCRPASRNSAQPAPGASEHGERV